MTLKELSQLYFLNREIELDKERIEILKLKACSPSIPNPTDIPIRGYPDSSIERYNTEINNLENILAEKINQCLHERNRLERYIAGIDDSLIRQIFTLRFVNGLSWQQVANRVGGNTADSVRKMSIRYINKQDGIRDI